MLLSLFFSSTKERLMSEENENENPAETVDKVIEEVTETPKEEKPFGGFRSDWEHKKHLKNKAKEKALRKSNGFPPETMKAHKFAVINEGRAIVLRCQKVGINTEALEKAFESTVKLFD